MTENKTKDELIEEIRALQQELDSVKKEYEDDLIRHKKIEVELLKEQDFTKKILDCLPGIFYLYTYPELRLVYWNKNHETQLGFTSEEISNKYIMDWHIPEAKPLVQEAVDIVMQKGQNVLESPLLNKDGVYIPFLMTGVRFETPDQNYLMGFGIDITDRKKIEIARQESEALFRLLAENSTDMITKHDEHGNYLYVSPSCKTMLGYDPEELIGHSAFEFIHPDDQVKIEESRKSVINNEKISSSIFQIRKKDGTYIWLETISKAIIDKNNGNVKEIHASSRDITNRKLADDRLQESERNLSMLFGAMTEMVALHELVFDDNNNVINYRIIDCNIAYSKITGIKKEAAVGRLSTEVYQTDTPPYLEEFSKVALTGNPFDYNTYFAPMDKHFMITVVSPEKNKFATITTDITAIKQIQESIAEKNKELENYLYVASHDLRSPLVNIQGFSQRLQKQVDSISSFMKECDLHTEKRPDIDSILIKDVPKTLNFISSNVAKMDSLINGLLQISRTGRIKMTISKVDMNELIKAVVSAHNFEITEKSAQVHVDHLPECYGDINQLNQLFSNIISNAIKYNDTNKQLIITISAKVQYNKVVYCIKDTGIGIASRHLKRIWDVFYRVDSNSSVPGEGLGLSIAKRIIDKHKGRIWIESEEGAGSSFFIELRNNDFTEL